jgi:hypothetical protein
MSPFGPISDPDSLSKVLSLNPQLVESGWFLLLIAEVTRLGYQVRLSTMSGIQSALQILFVIDNRGDKVGIA